MIQTRLTRPQLRLRSAVRVTDATPRTPTRPRHALRDIVLCWGGQGKRVGLRLKFILREFGADWVIVRAVDGDAFDLPTLTVPGYAAVTFEKDEVLTLGAEKTRDDLRADPFLRARYDKGGLWRGIPVSETFQRGGRGGLSYPVYATGYYECERERALTALHQWLALLVAPPPAAASASDLQTLHQQSRQQQTMPHAKPHRAVTMASGVGSWGWNGHALGSYDLRLAMKTLGVVNYEAWAVVLGPNIYAGLTRNIQANWHALIDQLRYLSRHGLHRKYGGHGEDVDIDAPPYDPGRLFCADRARGPQDGRRATEEELDAFQWEVAISLALLLTTEAGDQLVTYSANPDPNGNGHRQQSGEELFGTLGSALAGTDLTGIQNYLQQKTKLRILNTLKEQV